MKGEQKNKPELFNYAVNLERRVRGNHPLQREYVALQFRGRFAGLFSAGRFFRKLESDLTVFKFQMSGKRPPLF
jgi:hypothetical protein